MNERKLMRDKSVLITEGNTASARMIATKFAKEGAHIVLFCDTFDDTAMHTKFLVEKNNVDCLLMIGDINDHAYCKEIILTIKTKYKKLDVLINNSFTSNLSLANLPSHIREKLLEISRLKVFIYQKLTESAIKIMEPKASIINHQIVENGWGDAYWDDDVTEKDAYLHNSIKVFTEFYSKRLEKKGIRSNAIISHTTVTNPTRVGMDIGKDGFSFLGTGKNFQMGCPFSFLMSDDSLDINGEILFQQPRADVYAYGWSTG
jgi:NAD(P)-dependent dehydrogenase (short-subunit alcohol dehydrogenase family)